MASLEELDRTTPAYYTLSNHKLLIIARVREETVYFFDQLSSNTTVILLADPECYEMKYTFLDFLISMGCTVIDLKEKETFNKNYKMNKKSIDILSRILTDYKYDMIITHPQYSRDNDSQNRAIFDFVSDAVSKLKTNNHYTYNKIGRYGVPDRKCNNDIKSGMLKLYAKIASDGDKQTEHDMIKNYEDISRKISGIRKVIPYKN